MVKFNNNNYLFQVMSSYYLFGNPEPHKLENAFFNGASAGGFKSYKTPELQRKKYFGGLNTEPESPTLQDKCFDFLTPDSPDINSNTMMDIMSPDRKFRATPGCKNTKKDVNLVSLTSYQKNALENLLNQYQQNQYQNLQLQSSQSPPSPHSPFRMTNREPREQTNINYNTLSNLNEVFNKRDRFQDTSNYAGIKPSQDRMPMFVPRPRETYPKDDLFTRINLMERKSVRTWNGTLPPKNDMDQVYCRKVFLGGVPWDITNENLNESFGRYGELSVQWPIRNGQDSIPKGYVYIVFKNEKSVNLLLEACENGQRNCGEMRDSTTYKYYVQSKKMKRKEIQVIPWIIADSVKVVGSQTKLDIQCKTVFVGALHGMLTAQGLTHIMNDLFGNVVYVEIDTDQYKYPMGSGRVTFSEESSFYQAIKANYVTIRTPKFEKKIQIEPYIEDSMNCDLCKKEPGPLFCRTCFRYFSKQCWDDYHRHRNIMDHKQLTRSRKMSSSM